MNGDASERLGERVGVIERRVHRLGGVQVVRVPGVHPTHPRDPPTGEDFSHGPEVGERDPCLARSQRGGVIRSHGGDCPPHRVR